MRPRELIRSVLVTVAGRAEVMARRHNWLSPQPPGEVMHSVETSKHATEPKSNGVAESQPRSVAVADVGHTGERGFADFNELLHELRSIELARMPKTSGTVLSAGASGTLYFEWIARCYGPISRHIGLELYLPEPEALPPEVTWVKASVGNMTGVDTGSVSLVFSGQNFEHLFGDDAVGFLLECHRVLALGGALVIDSPNRDIASAATWTQPEHTIEFTPAEATDLLTLAGFDVTSLRGVWLCVDPVTGERLDLWQTGDAVPPIKEIVSRSVLATDRPEASFVWWLEAARSERTPGEAALRARHAEIFEMAWKERQQRLSHQVGERRELDGKKLVRVAKGVAGWAMFGPYMPLVPGAYRVDFEMRLLNSSTARATDLDVTAAEVDVADVAGSAIVSRRVTVAELPRDEWISIPLSFDITELTWGVQFRVFGTGASELEVVFETNLTSDAEGIAPTFV